MIAILFARVGRREGRRSTLRANRTASDRRTAGVGGRAGPRLPRAVRCSLFHHSWRGQSALAGCDRRRLGGGGLAGLLQVWAHAAGASRTALLPAAPRCNGPGRWRPVRWGMGGSRGSGIGPSPSPFWRCCCRDRIRWRIRPVGFATVPRLPPIPLSLPPPAARPWLAGGRSHRLVGVHLETTWSDTRGTVGAARRHTETACGRMRPQTSRRQDGSSWKKRARPLR